VEDHNVIGGLGSFISEMMVENGISAKLVKLGIKDRFGKSGEPQELANLFGIGEAAIEKAIREVVL
jgi:transketolase